LLSTREIHEFDVNSLDLDWVSEVTGVSLEDDMETLRAIASDCSTGFHVLHLLAHHTSKSIREKVAWNPQTVTGTLSQLLLDSDEFVAGGVAANENLTEIQRAACFRSESVYQRYCLGLNTSISTETQYALFNDEFVIKITLAANPSLDPTLLDKLSYENDSEILNDVASNPSTLPFTLSRLAKNREVETAVAANPNTPVLALTFLITSDNYKTQKAALNNPSLPDTLKKRYQEEIDNKSRSNLVENLIDLISFIPHMSETKKIELSERPLMDISVLSILSLDPSVEVRKRVALHPKAGDDIVKRLALDCEEVQLALLKRDDLSADIYDLLASRV
jgi:hypothetical protein